MMYEFAADDGEILLVERSMHDPPAIGEPVEKDGKVYRRIFSVPLRTPESRKGSSAFPRFESQQLPRKVEGDKEALRERARRGDTRASKHLEAIEKSEQVYRGFERSGGTFSPQGKPRITNRHQADLVAEVMSDGDEVEVSYDA